MKGRMETNERTILMLKGLPASGKSTWAKAQLDLFPDKYKRINKDDFRAMLDNGRYTKSNEALILQFQEHIVSNALKKGFDVIIDDTNFEDRHYERMCQIAQSQSFPVKVIEKYFPIDVKEAVERDSKRPNPVGETVVYTFYNRYVRGKVISIKEKVFSNTKEPIIKDPTLPNSIICDLDGTLAIIHNRMPFDASKADGDLVNEPVLNTIQQMYATGYNLIFVSGREEKFKPQTEIFLKRHLGHIPYELYMRKTGDFRADNIIKKDLFNEHIRGKTNVLYVIDDRPRVVRMWRHELGLTVFQLNDIEF